MYHITDLIVEIYIYVLYMTLGFGFENFQSFQSLTIKLRVYLESVDCEKLSKIDCLDLLEAEKFIKIKCQLFLKRPVLKMSKIAKFQNS